MSLNHQVMKITTITVFGILMLLIIFGNSLVLISLKRIRSLQKTTKIMITSLCVADLMVGVINLPIRLLEIINPNPTRSIGWCKLSICCSLLSLYASILNLLTISIERYIFIVKPYHFTRQVTTRRTIPIVLVVWLIAFMFSCFPIISGAGLQQNAEKRKTGEYICRFATTLSHGYLVSLVLMYVISATVMGVLYYRIFITARRHERMIASVTTLAQSPSITVAEKQQRTVLKSGEKAAKMLGIVVGVLYLHWTPWAVAIGLSITHKHLVTQLLIFIVMVLVSSNSFMNSVIYYQLNREFRNIYGEIFGRIAAGCCIVFRCKKCVYLRRRRFWSKADISSSVES